MGLLHEVFTGLGPLAVHHGGAGAHPLPEKLSLPLMVVLGGSVFFFSSVATGKLFMFQ